MVAIAPNFPADTTVFSASYGSMNLFLRSRNRGFGWNNMRSGMRGFKITDCEVAPDCEHSELLFVALAEFGLQRSTNAGTTWEKPLLEGTITQVESGPLVNGERLVVCSGENRVLRSRDGGNTWTTWMETLSPVHTLALANDEGQTVAVGTKQRVYILDGDRKTSAQLPSPAHTLEFSPQFAQDRTLLVGTIGHGLLVSHDGGRSFAPVEGETPFMINDIVVAPTWPECQDLFVATPKDGVHASRDGGKTWQRLPMHVVETYQSDDHYQCLAIAANYPEDKSLYCGCYEGLYCSTDGGEHWCEMVLNPTRIGRKVAISPNYKQDGTVFLGCYGHALTGTNDHGQTWQSRSRGIRTMGMYSVATSPDYANDQTVILGAGEGRIRRSQDGGKTWDQHNLKPVTPSKKIGSFAVRQVQFSPGYAEDQTVFAITAAGFYTSGDGGGTWTGKGVPIDWTWRLSVPPNWQQSKTVFVGGYNVWRSTDLGDSWQRLRQTGKVLGLVSAPDFETSNEVFLVSERQGLLRSRDRGDSWQRIQAFEGYSPTKIRLSPDYGSDHTLLVSTVSGGMFKSTDRGDSWSRIAPLGSDADTCFDFVLSPDYAADKTLFGCTYGGLIRSTDDGVSWQLLTDVELYDDARDPWILTGEWQVRTLPRSICTGTHCSERAGDTVSLCFTGTQITLYGIAGPEYGMCDILIDGEVKATVDAYATVEDAEFELYRSPELEQGFHDLIVRVRGEANERATGKRIAIDAAAVRYAPDDENNTVFAQLKNLVLTEEQSRARDTVLQNRNVADVRAEIDGKREAVEAVKATASPPKSTDLIELIRQMAADLADIKQQVTELGAKVDEQAEMLRKLQKR